MLFLSRLLCAYVPATVVQHETQQEHASPPSTQHCMRVDQQLRRVELMYFHFLYYKN